MCELCKSRYLLNMNYVRFDLFVNIANLSEEATKGKSESGVVDI